MGDDELQEDDDDDQTDRPVEVNMPSLLKGPQQQRMGSAARAIRASGAAGESLMAR